MSRTVFNPVCETEIVSIERLS